MMTQPPRKRRRTSQNTAHHALWPDYSRWLDYFRRLGLLPVLALTALVAPFVPAPQGSVRWHGAQTACVEAGAALLLAALLCRPWPISSLRFSARRVSFEASPLARLPFVFLSLLLLCELISCLLSPTPFAVQGLLLLGLGVLVAGVTAASAVSPSRVLFVAASVVIPAALVALTGLAQLGNGSLPLAIGVLHDHQLFGAFLLLSLPLCLALALAPGPLAQRLAGQVALLICAAGLWESQNRSAWLGTAVSLAAFAGLFWGAYRDTSSKSRRQRRQDSGSHAGDSEMPDLRLNRGKNAIVPALLGFVALAGFILISPNLNTLFTRMRSTAPVMHSSDESFRWRKIVWLGTRRMIAEKPLAGWGVGSFPAQHEPFTHTGHPAGIVSMRGPSIEDEAHDSYLQIWADLGIAGLLLWLGAFFALIGTAVQSLRRLPSGSLEQWLLIGSVSAIVGQMVDALANPAWQFGNIALPLWIVFGLTSALSAPARASQTPPARRFVWRVAQYFFAAGVGLWLLSLVWRTAFALPAPHL